MGPSLRWCDVVVHRIETLKQAKLKPMKTFSHIKIALLASSLLLCPAVWAESAPITVPVDAQTAADVPWLYEGSDVPIDKSWTFGKLENGLRYAVKNNQVTSGQVSIRVRIDAGALHEEDDEQGFAHLLEHLAFRGSEFVPDGESKRIWQRLGVSFGSDSNALLDACISERRTCPCLAF